ncbi:DEAD/DEAH box helicase [Candidatus Manganitrophus noduliformans]|nr:DEAD/DEAH box helicase [Candidatus Manganitrophus noduliformans]
MKMRFLEKVGIDTDVIPIWEKRYGPELLPVQEKAIQQTSLLQGGNLVVFAPTTSGKTFIAEILAIFAIRKGKRVFYLVPTKSLAEEKFAQFREAYRSLGIVTAISTRDHREWDAAILSKGFDIAIVVYEKLQSLLVTRPCLLEEVGVVILDELQMIADEERGPTIELLLTKLLHARVRPQFLGLSAVLGEGEALARWLQADLLIEEKRPVELRKGIFCRGIFSYREHNSGKEGEELWKEMRGEEEIDLMVPLASFLGGEREESTLLFLKDKPTVESAAVKIGEQVGLAPAEEAVEELLALEETTARDFLIRLLRKGIGIHHADLPLEQRQVIERHFRMGAIRILASTSTLAMGINCPAKNVLIESRQWHYFRRYHGTDTRPLPRSLHENMAGRGGRYGYIGDFGRAILVTHSSFRKKVWMDQYIAGMIEPLEPALRMEEIEEILLNLVASGEAATSKELAGFLKSTYTAQRRWKEKADSLEPLIASAVEKCQNQGALQAVGENRVVATGLGQITVLKGIRLATAVEIRHWMKTTDPSRLTDLEILYALALTEDAKRIYIPLPYRERRSRNYPSLLRKEIAHQQEGGKEIFQPRSGAVRPSEAEEARAVKKALLLQEWITSRSTVEIEQLYDLHAGAIARIGEAFSRLAEAASALAREIGWTPETVRSLSELSERLLQGVTVQGLALSRIHISGLSRTAIARLVREGYDSPEALLSLPIEILEKYLPGRVAAALFLQLHADKAQKQGEDQNFYRQRDHAREPSQEYPSRSEASPVLSIDLDQQLITYKDIRVELSSYPFKLLAALARTPGRVVNKVALYDALYGSAEKEDEDDRPYERQLADHKRKILAQIRKAVGNQKKRVILSEEIENLIAVRRGVGYTLNLNQREVSIHKETALR